MCTASMLLGISLFLAGFGFGCFIGGKLGEMEEKIKQTTPTKERGSE